MPQKTSLFTYREVWKMSISGITFGGRNNLSTTRMRGSDHSPSFMLKQADKTHYWTNLRTMDVLWSASDVSVLIIPEALENKLYAIKFYLRSQVSSFSIIFHTFCDSDIMIAANIILNTVGKRKYTIHERKILSSALQKIKVWVQQGFLYKDKDLPMNT